MLRQPKSWPLLGLNVHHLDHLGKEILFHFEFTLLG